MDILEFNTDDCVLGDGVIIASFRLLVQVGSVRTWHYYGTLVPGGSIAGVPTVQHNAISVLLNTSDLMDAARSLARDIAVEELSA